MPKSKTSSALPVPHTTKEEVVDYYQRYGTKMRQDLIVHYQLSWWPKFQEEHNRLKFWRPHIIRPLAAFESHSLDTPAEVPLSCWFSLCNKSTFLYDATDANSTGRLYPQLDAKWATCRSMEEVYDMRFVVARIVIDPATNTQDLITRHNNLYEATERYLRQPQDFLQYRMRNSMLPMWDKDLLIDSTLHPSCKAAFLVSDDSTYQTLLVVLTGSNDFQDWTTHIIEQPTPFSARMKVEHAFDFVRAIDVENQKTNTEISTRCSMRRITLMTKSLPNLAERNMLTVRDQATDTTYWSGELMRSLARVRAAEQIAERQA